MCLYEGGGCDAPVACLTAEVGAQYIALLLAVLQEEICDEVIPYKEYYA